MATRAARPRRAEDIQREFLEAGERLFFQGSVNIGGPVRAARPLPLPRMPSQSTVARLRRLHQKLSGVAKRTPEVMVKISGAGRCSSRIRAHLRYISRRGQIELEDQDGERHVGRAAVHDVFDTWQDRDPIPEDEIETGPGSTARAGRRESLQIVLSMAAGTPHAELQRAAREFAEETFADHKYVMAFHTPETDPDPRPSPHPHFHLTVKAVSSHGRRLNPRKADLQLWRERFAQKLRDNGIEANATSRAIRGQRNPGRSSANVHRQVRQAVLKTPQRRIPVEDAVARNRATAASVLRDWATVLNALEDPRLGAHHELADALRDRLGFEDHRDVAAQHPSFDEPSRSVGKADPDSEVDR